MCHLRDELTKSFPQGLFGFKWQGCVTNLRDADLDIPRHGAARPNRLPWDFYQVSIPVPVSCDLQDFTPGWDDEHASAHIHVRRSVSHCRLLAVRDVEEGHRL